MTSPRLYSQLNWINRRFCFVYVLFLALLGLTLYFSVWLHRQEKTNAVVYLQSIPLFGFLFCGLGFTVADGIIRRQALYQLRIDNTAYYIQNVIIGSRHLYFTLFNTFGLVSLFHFAETPLPVTSSIPSMASFGFLLQFLHFVALLSTSHPDSISLSAWVPTFS